MRVIDREYQVQIDSLMTIIEDKEKENQRHIQYLNRILNSQRRLIEKFRDEYRMIQVIVKEETPDDYSVPSAEEPLKKS